LSANGSFTYKPNTDWSGTDSFTYKANNGLSDSNVATVTIIVNNLTPDQEIKKELEEMVKALVTAGALNAGQGNSLIAKCEVGIAKIKAGQKNNGCALLLSFINEVQSLIDNGDLKEEQGQPLIDKARNIMGELGCTS